MGKHFSALSERERKAVSRFVLAEYDRLLFKQHADATARAAQHDPDGWMARECERIASDASLVNDILKKWGTRGFTLIELSMVLVIIGLIVGGVLVGQDLIRAAQVRAQISQIEKFNQAVNTFYGKYGALPGDLNQQVATTFGFTPRGPWGGQGDGNGLLQGNGNCNGCNYGFVAMSGEILAFWVDLTTANGLNVNLIDGSFNTGSPWNAQWVTATTVPLFFPAAKIGGGNFVYVYSTGVVANTTGVNYYGVAAVTGVSNAGGCGGCIDSMPGLTVRQAYDIDKKIDDGLPLTGSVIAAYASGNACGGGGVCNPSNAATPSSSTCYDTTSGNYSITVSNGSNVNCALSFKMQAGD
jgi:prepilin-type N-terminal cleavage/methylation domain-containing protein